MDDQISMTPQERSIAMLERIARRRERYALLLTELTGMPRERAEHIFRPLPFAGRMARAAGLLPR